MLKNNNIENIFKESFEGFSVEPSGNLWAKINRKLNMKEFFKFNPGKFNAYYALLIIAASTVLLINLNNSANNQTNGITAEINDKSNVISSENSIVTFEDQNNETNEDISVSENNSKVEMNINKTETDQINPHNNIYVNNNINTEEESNSEGKITNEKLAKPYANFNPSSYEACEPAAITFFNASENCDKYYWEFGNGETSSLKNPTFVFRTAGVYSVTLTVTSGSISNSFSKEIKINEKPIAEIQIDNKENLFINENLNFTNSSTDCGKNRWNFGDGSISTFTNPEHKYTSPGNYNISLICYNQSNCSDTAYLNDLEINDEKYKIEAPTGITISLNGAESGYWRGISNTKAVFHLFFNYEVAEFNLVIFSRFGSEVFRSNNPEFGWNGYYNNKPGPDQSTYIWRCNGKFIDGTEFNKVGNLSLFYSRH